MTAPMARPPVERLTMSVPEVAEALGLSEVAIYALLDRGVLPEVPRVNRRRLIPRRAITQLIDVAMENFDPKAALREIADFDEAGAA